MPATVQQRNFLQLCSRQEAARESKPWTLHIKVQAFKKYIDCARHQIDPFTRPLLDTLVPMLTWKTTSVFSIHKIINESTTPFDHVHVQHRSTIIRFSLLTCICVMQCVVKPKGTYYLVRVLLTAVAQITIYKNQQLNRGQLVRVQKNSIMTVSNHAGT